MNNRKRIDNLQSDRMVPFEILEDVVLKSAGGRVRKFLHLIERRFLLNGQYRKYWITSRSETPSQEVATKKADAVIVCGIVESPESRYLVLTSQLRIGIGGYELGFPAGLVDEGETVKQAAIREFREETGLDLEVSRVSPNLYSSAGLTEESVPMVFGTATGVVSEDYLEKDENILTILASPSYVKKIIDGEFDIAYGAKAWCAMFGILNDDGTDFRI